MSENNHRTTDPVITKLRRWAAKNIDWVGYWLMVAAVAAAYKWPLIGLPLAVLAAAIFLYGSWKVMR